MLIRSIVDNQKGIFTFEACQGNMSSYIELIASSSHQLYESNLDNIRKHYIILHMKQEETKVGISGYVTDSSNQSRHLLSNVGPYDRYMAYRCVTAVLEVLMALFL